MTQEQKEKIISYTRNTVGYSEAKDKESFMIGVELAISQFEELLENNEKQIIFVRKHNRRTNSCYIINGHTYTAKQLAEKYNLPYQRLSDWFKKGIPPEEAIEKLSSMLSYTS